MFGVGQPGHGAEQLGAVGASVPPGAVIAGACMLTVAAIVVPEAYDMCSVSADCLTVPPQVLLCSVPSS